MSGHNPIYHNDRFQLYISRYKTVASTFSTEVKEVFPERELKLTRSQYTIETRILRDTDPEDLHQENSNQSTVTR